MRCHFEIDHIRIKLATDAVVKGGALQVTVKQGVVTLSGAGETAKQKAKAERLAKRVKGVKKVGNQIVIKKSAGVQAAK